MTLVIFIQAYSLGGSPSASRSTLPRSTNAGESRTLWILMSSFLNCSKPPALSITEVGITPSHDSGNMHTFVGENSSSEISRSRSRTSLISVTSNEPPRASGRDAFAGCGFALFDATAASLAALSFFSSPLLPSFGCALPPAPPIGGSEG